MKKLKLWFTGILICGILLTGCGATEEKAINKEASSTDGNLKEGGNSRKEEKGIPYIVVDIGFNQVVNVVGTNHFEDVQCIDLSLEYYNLGASIDVGESGQWGDWKHRSGFQIASGAFKDCSALRQITILSYSNVTYVAEDAFQGCSKDLTVYCEKDSSLWKRLQEIGIHVKDVNPIENRESDKSVQERYPEYSPDEETLFVLDTENTLVGFSNNIWPFQRETGKRTVVQLPKETRKIEKYLFTHAADANNNEEIIIPERVEEICKGAFLTAEFGKITFSGNNLRKIGDDAFRANFSSMEEEKIELPEGVEDVGEGVFGFTKAKEIIIPESVKIVGKDFISHYTTPKLVIKGKDTKFEEWSDFAAENMKSSETVVYCHKASKAEKLFKKLGCEISYLE